MEVRITIKLDNAAFEDNCEEEVVRILRSLIANLPLCVAGEKKGIRDVNGNTVGEFRVTKG